MRRRHSFRWGQGLQEPAEALAGLGLSTWGRVSNWEKLKKPRDFRSTLRLLIGRFPSTARPRREASRPVDPLINKCVPVLHPGWAASLVQAWAAVSHRLRCGQPKPGRPISPETCDGPPPASGRLALRQHPTCSTCGKHFARALCFGLSETSKTDETTCAQLRSVWVSSAQCCRPDHLARRARPMLRPMLSLPALAH